MTQPRLINIFLLDGDPNGIRVAQISMSTIQAIAFRRNQLGRVRSTFGEIERPGVYVLLGADDADPDQVLAYIGESENVGKRLATHNSNDHGKDAKVFWNDTIVLISKDENLTKSHAGCVATFQKRQESDWSSWPGSVSCRHLEQVVDELNLLPNIRTAHPPRLPLPDHVHGLVALDRSPRRVACTKALLGLHSSFDRSMILLHDVVQVLDRPVAATASQDSFFFHLSVSNSQFSR